MTILEIDREYIWNEFQGSKPPEACSTSQESCEEYEDLISFLSDQLFSSQASQPLHVTQIHHHNPHFTTPYASPSVPPPAVKMRSPLTIAFLLLLSLLPLLHAQIVVEEVPFNDPLVQARSNVSLE